MRNAVCCGKPSDSTEARSAVAAGFAVSAQPVEHRRFVADS